MWLMSTLSFRRIKRSVVMKHFIVFIDWKKTPKQVYWVYSLTKMRKTVVSSIGWIAKHFLRLRVQWMRMRGKVIYRLCLHWWNEYNYLLTLIKTTKIAVFSLAKSTHNDWLNEWMNEWRFTFRIRAYQNFHTKGMSVSLPHWLKLKRNFWFLPTLHL